MGVAVHLQAHRAGEVLLQHPGLLRLAEVHLIVHTVSLRKRNKRGTTEEHEFPGAEVQPMQMPATEQKTAILIITGLKVLDYQSISPGRLKNKLRGEFLSYHMHLPHIL